ncbi:F-box protein CPR1-like isoform X1 [Mercurialis annua]|uniref:F-box protein CPR1-like isoform X1 n=1 Tax=Mercurialis annua TaxID=3986 RepID=UPI00215EEBAE|nr:F-box protein CPR1-like isoform X1 [Mercurialis annua]
MSDHLSEELVAEILKRLSVKSLLKCRSVCKLWYSLISNPSFISLHIAHTTQANKPYFLVQKNLTYPMKPQFVLHSDNESFSEFKQLGDYGNDVDVAGSCHGLVCLSDGMNNRLIVWNPAIGEFITTSLREHCNGTTHFVGFGFDSKSSAYKVVRIAYIAQIYGGVGRKMMIASFDLSNEVFEELMLPHALVDSSDPSVSLSVYCQSLALIHCEEPIFYDESYMSYTKCSIWVMREYGAAESWTKQFSVDLPNPGALLRVLSFQRHGGILIEDSNSEIASYDPRTQKVTPLCFHGYIFEVHSYMESLVLLKNRYS